MKNKSNFLIKNYKGYKKFIVVIFLVLSLVSLFLCVTSTVKYVNEKNSLISAAQNNAHEKIILTVKTLSKFINTLKFITGPLVDILEKSSPVKEKIENYLVQKPVEVTSFGIKFKPEFSPTRKYWAPCVSQVEGKSILEDYSLVFTGTINSEINWDKELSAHDTFSTHINEDILIEYRRNFYHKNVKTGSLSQAGIVFANLSRKNFEHLLKTLFYGQAGYWFIIEKDKGTFLIHPKKNFVDSKKSLLQFGEEKNNPVFKILYDRIRNENAGHLEYNNLVNGEPSWLYFESVPLTNWVLCGVFDKGDLLISPKQEKRDIINIFLFLFCFIILLGSTFVINNNYTIKSLWFISFLVSIVFTLGIATIWYITILYPVVARETGELIRDKIYLYKKIEEIKNKGRYFQRFLPEKKEENILSDDSNKEVLSKQLLKYLTFRYHSRNNHEIHTGLNTNQNYEYLIIPTGIFINHISYINQNQLEIGFFLWQRFTDKVHTTIKHDILLPKVAKSEKKVLYRGQLNGAEVVLWEVKCVLDQLADFTNYPFDINAVRIKIWPNEFDKKIILVPDFNAYNFVGPTFLPGLAHKNFLAGFNPIKSFFSYKETAYNVNFGIYNFGNFGIYDQLDKVNIPELYFNIIPQRRMLDIIITDLAPIIIIAFFIFYLFMTIEIHSYTMFRSGATVFFGLLLAHMRFRSKVPSNQFVYFDCLYLVLYVMILLLAILSVLNILFVKRVQYKGNLISKLLYWPIVLGSIFFLTLLYLY